VWLSGDARTFIIVAKHTIACHQGVASVGRSAHLLHIRDPPALLGTFWRDAKNASSNIIRRTPEPLTMPGQTVFPYNCKILSRTQITLRAGAALVESGRLFGLQDTGRGPVSACTVRSMVTLDWSRAAFDGC
jgi:hypothetical protein